MACSSRRRRRLRRARCGAPEGAPRRAGGYLRGGARPEEGGRAHIAMSLRRTDVKWSFLGGASKPPPAPPTAHPMHAYDGWELQSHVHPLRPPAPHLTGTYKKVFMVFLDWPPPCSGEPMSILMKPMNEPSTRRDYYYTFFTLDNATETQVRSFWDQYDIRLQSLGDGAAVAIICGIRPSDAPQGLVSVPYAGACNAMATHSTRFGKSISWTFNQIVKPMIQHRAAEAQQGPYARR